jgi:hypothetical protein
MTTSDLVVRMPDSPDDFLEFAEKEGWGDGLPLIPPTRPRVESMLGTTVDPQEPVARIGPAWGVATYEKIAINAVMAGCRAEYFPVVCAAVVAVADPVFNLYAIQATTSSAGPMLVVNGPQATELDFNGAGNAFGPGWRANATVGRAIRLIMSNIGGGRARDLAERTGQPALDFSCQGFPGKYTFCAAENERDSPWDPLHIDRGFAADVSTVTAFPVNSLHDYRDTTSKTGADLLLSIAAAMASAGTANLLYGAEPGVIISPEHAQILDRDGWSKRDVAEFLFERARVDLTKQAPAEQLVCQERRPKWADPSDFPICDTAADIAILVIGGPGIQGFFMSTFGGARSVTAPIQPATSSGSTPAGASAPGQ